MLYVTIQSLQQQNIFSDIYTLTPCPAGTKCEPDFCIYAKIKAQISCAANAQLISALLRYIDRTIPLLPMSEFQASSSLFIITYVRISSIFCGYAIRFVSDLVRKTEDRCCLYNVLSNNHWLSFTGDTRGHTMFSIISPI